MIPKKFLALSGLLLVGLLASAHEFWLEPQKFYFQAGEEAQVAFRVGENFVGTPWKAGADRVARFEHHAAGKVSDLRSSLTENFNGEVTVQPGAEGSHVLVMESSPAFISLSGEDFTAYLEEDGLDDVLYARRKAGTSGDSASEYYSRHAKLMLQAGNKTDEFYKKEYGLPIEIIPEANPALLKKGDPVAFKILYQGKPLFGAKVKVWNRHNHRISVQNIFSQQNGVIETHISNPGVWMVSVVKMVPSPDPAAQYRSYWGTLVFGVR